MFDFNAYAADFNHGDDRELAEKYFSEDMVYTGANRVIPDRAAFLEFLQFAHDGVREVMRPQLVLQNDHQIFAEIDMDFYALKARPDYPFGDLKPGDIVTVRFFVVYKLKDGKICELKSAIWPPDYKVSKAPVLGGSAGQRAAFQAYISAFSAGDVDRFTAYYCDDVVMELGSGPPLKGRRDIAEHYRNLFGKIRETLTIEKFVADEHGVAAEIVARFTALRDFPEFSVAPLMKDDAARLRTLILYTLRGGLISHIKVVRSGSPEVDRIRRDG